MAEDRSRSPYGRERHRLENPEAGDEGHGDQDLFGSVGIFVAENNLEPAAADALWQQSEEVQKSIIAEGAITGRNISAVLMARIRRTVAAVKQGETSDPVTRFVAENSLDSSAESNLRAQPLEVQQLVISEGKLTGRNLNAVLNARIRRTADGLAQSQYQQADDISNFCSENGIDAGAEQSLREQPPYIIQAVLSEGRCTGRNASAVLTSRIRRIQDGNGYAPSPLTMPQVPQFAPPYSNNIHPRRNIAGNGYGSSPLMMPQVPQFASQHSNSRYGMSPAQQSNSRYGMSPEPWSPAAEAHAFAAGNGVDGNAIAALMEAPVYIQQAIIREGPITGRNPSAILLSRLRRAEGTMARDVNAPQTQSGRALYSGPLADQVNAFIAENSINEDAAWALYEADPRIQKHIIEEGAITGRNTSAILLSRIRRATY